MSEHTEHYVGHYMHVTTADFELEASISSKQIMCVY